MPGTLGDFGVDLISSLGGKPTKQSRKLFSAWQQREGGWSNNDATFNPLNLTAPGSGLPTINSVGVVRIPTYQAGIKRTADLIRSGYPAIYQALRSGQVDFNNPALQADFNRWVSGQRTPGMSKYVSGVASSYGQNIPVSQMPTSGKGVKRPTPQQPVAALPDMTPKFDPLTYAQSILGQYATGGSMDFTQLPSVVQSSFKAPPLPPPAAPGAPSPKAATPGAAPPGQPLKWNGKTMVLPTEWKSTHPTDGLADQGFTHAEDIMGHPGTAVGAPEAGTVIRHGSAQGGQSLWLRADSGRMYWIGHIESDIPVGTKVTRGQRIAMISADHPRPHVHLDWSTSYGG
jgi:Peptidase family M23